MSPRSVVVIHRERMVAEGIAAALSQYPQIMPIGIGMNAKDGRHLGERADAVAIDESLPGGRETAAHLRTKGVRVVLVGASPQEEEGTKVSMEESVASLAKALVPESSLPGRRFALTRRQEQILMLVARGFAGKQVARHLGISPKTVERHKTRIFAKLGVPNQTAAIRLLLANGAGGTPWIRSSI